ncbi:MAG: Mut7-C RNAse domain-containing protein, partial [Haloferacaceae archaeon]
MLDAMLGKLATYLRMCGYDAAYVLDGVDDPADG